MEKKGVWGNNSARVERTIPTLVENDDRASKVASGKLPTFKYKATGTAPTCSTSSMSC